MRSWHLTFGMTPVVAPDVIEARQAAGVPRICRAQTATQALTAHTHGSEFGKALPAPLRTHAAEVRATALRRPRTQIMMNGGNPDEALALSFMPNDGVGLARIEFIIGTAIGCGGLVMALLVYILNRGQYHPLARAVATWWRSRGGEVAVSYQAPGRPVGHDSAAAVRARAVADEVAQAPDLVGRVPVDRLEDGLESMEVPVDVRDNGDAHGRTVAKTLARAAAAALCLLAAALLWRTQLPALSLPELESGDYFSAGLLARM